MRQITWEDFLCVLLLLSLFANVFLLYRVDSETSSGIANLEVCKNSVARCTMLDGYLFNHTSYIDGIYFSNSHYCVWTENLSFKEINTTEYHEACHDFVYNGYDHFCEGTLHK